MICKMKTWCCLLCSINIKAWYVRWKPGVVYCVNRKDPKPKMRQNKECHNFAFKGIFLNIELGLEKLLKPWQSAVFTKMWCMKRILPCFWILKKWKFFFIVFKKDLLIKRNFLWSYCYLYIHACLLPLIIFICFFSLKCTMFYLVEK